MNHHSLQHILCFRIGWVTRLYLQIYIQKVNFSTSFDYPYSVVFTEIFVFVKLHLLKVKFNIIFDNEILMMTGNLMTYKYIFNI